MTSTHFIATRSRYGILCGYEYNSHSFQIGRTTRADVRSLRFSRIRKESPQTKQQPPFEGVRRHTAQWIESTNTAAYLIRVGLLHRNTQTDTARLPPAKICQASSGQLKKRTDQNTRNRVSSTKEHMIETRSNYTLQPFATYLLLRTHAPLAQYVRLRHV
jgi:hypothetical protein